MNCVYEVTITDANKIAYINENGLAIKGASGLTAKVTVTITESETTGDDDNNTGTDNNNSGNTGNNENTGTGNGTESGNSSNTGNNESTGSGSDDGNNSGDQGENSGNTGDGEAGDGENTGGEQTTTLPTWVGIDGGFRNNNEWKYTELTETNTKGIWSVTIENITYQWPDFQIQAGGDKKIYAGSTTEWTKVDINGDAVPLVESEQKLGTTCWENDSETTSINLKVTVDFTGEKPTIKLETVK
ncbi:MAG: hypothetical protein HDR33_12135 [Treponema sp.]|nr:hypothetical protein [Treponema sp.]